MTGIALVGLRTDVAVRALSAVNRFRAIRTFDLTVLCFPEKQFKASLTAAQRAMRALKKANFVRMYRTDRLQHIAGLTAKGAKWLQDHDVDCTASVRRVSDMTNPEHGLWSNFLVLCCEARGLIAQNESELLRALNPPQASTDRHALVQGPLSVTIHTATKSVQRVLRPDVLAFDAAGEGGATWFEIDRSKRGADRETCLRLLFGKVGSALATGHVLKRVVVFAKTSRIETRALDIARKLVLPPDHLWNGAWGKFALRELAGEPGIFEVWRGVKNAQGDQVPGLVGYVIVQLLPLWLPRVRLDGRTEPRLDGWLDENYLPFRRPAASEPWPVARAPGCKQAR